MSTNILVNHIPEAPEAVAGGGTVTDIIVDSPNGTIDVTNGEVTTSGTIHIDVDLPSVIGNLYNNPSLVTLDHTLGGLFNAGVGVPTVVFVTSDNAGTIGGTTTINATNGDLTAGWELVVTFLVAATTIVHGSNFSSTGAKTLPTSASSGQSFRYIWDDSAGKYKYYA